VEQQISSKTATRSVPDIDSLHCKMGINAFVAIHTEFQMICMLKFLMPYAGQVA